MVLNDQQYDSFFRYWFIPINVIDHLTYGILSNRPAELNGNATNSSPEHGVRELQSRNVEESLVQQTQTVFSYSPSIKQLNKSSDESADDVLKFSIVDIKGSIDNAPEKRRWHQKQNCFVMA